MNRCQDSDSKVSKSPLLMEPSRFGNSKVAQFSLLSRNFDLENLVVKTRVIVA